MAQLPSNVGYGTVRGVFLRGVADSADPDKAPDALPIVGIRAVFTPNIDPAVVRVSASNPPVTLLIDPVEATTNENGELVGLDDSNPGVPLIASLDPDIMPNGWTWTLTLEATGFPLLTVTFTVAPDQELDLATAIPVPPNPGNDLAQWTAAVTETVSARNEVRTLKTTIDDNLSKLAFVYSETDGSVSLLEYGAVKQNGTDPNSVLITTNDSNRALVSVLAVDPVTKKLPAAYIPQGVTDAVATTQGYRDQVLAQTNNVITGAALSGDNLVLSKAGGGTINVGSVRGLQGLPGDQTPAQPTAGASSVFTLNIAQGPQIIPRILQGDVSVNYTGTGLANYSYAITLIMIQDATGGRKITWPAGIKWAEGIPLQPSPAPNAISMYHIIWVGSQGSPGNFVFGFSAGQNFA